MPAVRRVVFGLLAAAVGTIHASSISDVITCYAFNGAAFPNNTRCPGSDACCGIDATCLSNRLCHKPGDGAGTFVRGPCAVKPWNKGQCAQVCEYNEEKGLFPRVTICGDGSFCCNKDGDHCCDDKKGTFLDKSGNIAKGPATTTLSWGPERTSSGYQTVTATHTTVTTAVNTPSQTPTSSPTPDESNNNAAKIGAGVGVPVGVLAIGGLAAFFFLRRRKQREYKPAGVPELGAEGEQKKVVYTGPPVHPQELDGHENQVHRSELPA